MCVLQQLRPVSTNPMGSSPQYKHHRFDPSDDFFSNKVFLRGVFIDFLWFSSVFLSNKQSGHSKQTGPSREKCAERHGFYDGWRFSPQTQNRLFHKKTKKQKKTKKTTKTTNPLARVVRVLQHLRPCFTNPV